MVFYSKVCMLFFFVLLLGGMDLVKIVWFVGKKEVVLNVYFILIKFEVGVCVLNYWVY